MVGRVVGVIGVHCAASACCLALVVGAIGCASDPTPAATPKDAGAPCDGESDAGTCPSAGLPSDMPCPPGHWLNDAGACMPAGVPPDGCGEGFVSDNNGGCEPILPPNACAKGQVAVPGEATCHDIAPCGAGTWGDIPVDATTQYVDQSFTGASDGSAAKPWTKIANALAAAKAGGIIAIAAGSYAEDVVLDTRPLRVWGRCAAKVEITGTGSYPASVGVIGPVVTKSELHGVAITSATGGVFIDGASDVVLDGIWVHDTNDRGLTVQDALGAASAKLSHALVERTHDAGIFIAGTPVSIDSVVFRDTYPAVPPQYPTGVGVYVQKGAKKKQRGNVTIHSSVIEGNQEVGVWVLGSDGAIENSLVRATLQGPADQGWGVAALVDETGDRANLHLESSVVEQNRHAGVVLQGSDATLEAMVVRGTQPDSVGLGGVGIAALFDSGQSSQLGLKRSLLDQNHSAGVLVTGSGATIEGTAIRSTIADVKGAGAGLAVQDDEVGAVRGTLELRWSALAQNAGSGVFLGGSDAKIDATLIQATTSSAGALGAGIAARYSCTPAPNVTCDPARRSTASVYATSVESPIYTGILVVTSDVTIEACVVQEAKAVAGAFGDGVAVVADMGPASAAITATRIERSSRAGVSSFGADVVLGSSVLQCQAFDLDGEQQQGLAFTFHDQGGNLCGCPQATRACKLVSSKLAPPPSVGGLP